MIRLMLRWMRPMPGLRCLGAFGSLMPNRLNRRPRFTLTNQRQQVRFKACAVVCRMTKQELNESALPRAKMPVHSAAGKTVQNAERLLGKETFEFVGSHGVSLKFNTSNTGRAQCAMPTTSSTHIRVTAIPPELLGARWQSLGMRSPLMPGACPSGCGVVKETRACVQAGDKYRPRPSWSSCRDRSR
jgi:hypothetical protein